MKISYIIRLIESAARNRGISMIFYLTLAYWLFFDILPVFLNDSQIGGAFIVTLMFLSLFTAMLKFLSLSTDAFLFLITKAKLSSKGVIAFIVISLPAISKKLRNFTPLRIPKNLIKMYR